MDKYGRISKKIYGLKRAVLPVMIMIISSNNMAQVQPRSVKYWKSCVIYFEQYPEYWQAKRASIFQGVALFANP
jgi:hypothetical protein